MVLQQRMEKYKKGKQKYPRVFQKQVLQTAVLKTFEDCKIKSKTDNSNLVNC